MNATNRVPFNDLAPHRLTAGASNALRQLKNRVVQNLAWHLGADLPGPLIQKAVNEAESLAILTPFPSLVLPLLAEEKLGQIRGWYHHQEAIRRAFTGGDRTKSFAA